MQIHDEDLKNGVILEEIRDQNRAILEGLSDLRGMPSKVNQIAGDVEVIKTDIKAIKAVMKDHSSQLNNHETRITQLETA